MDEKKIKVLVVDDSAFMRRMISDILNSHPEMTVVGIAQNGQAALDQIERLNPDIITLDVEMPVMNGLDVLKILRDKKPIPVIMLSSLTRAGAEVTIQALELGAFDFISKPDLHMGMTLDVIKNDLIAKVLLANKIGKQRIIAKTTPFKIQPILPKSSTSKQKTVVIGVSTGGPQSLKEVIPFLPKDLQARILIVQHMPPKFTDMFAQRLDKLSQIDVREAKESDPIINGQALVAPGDYHMAIDKNGVIKLNQDPPLWGVRPSVDITLASAAELYKEDLICVIMTGMGRDGTQGAGIVKRFGGHCIAQDQSTSIIYGMPKSVIDAGYADEIVPLNKIAESIVKAIYR